MQSRLWLLVPLFVGLAAAPGWAQEDLTSLSAEKLTSRADAAQKEAEQALTDIDARKEELKAAKLKLTEAEATPSDLDPINEAKATVEAKEGELAAAEEALESSLEKLSSLVAVLSDKDAEVGSYESFLLENGKLSGLSTGAVVGIFDKWFQKGKTWVVDEGPGVLIGIVQFLAILLGFSILSKVVGKVVGRTLRTSRLKVSDLLRSFFVNTTIKLVFLFGLVIALGTIGIDVGPLLAAIGVAGFVIGFALQDTLGNFASGIMILLYRPYDIGDVIKATGVLGTVKAMNLVSTTIVTGDNQCEIVPNKSIWGGVITNITANPTRRVDLVVGVGYEADLERTKKVLSEVVSKHPQVHAEPAPVIRLHNLGESSVDFVVRPWCNTSDYWGVYWDLHEQIKQRLDDEGISIPFPQRDLHLHYVEGKAPAGAAS